MADQRYERSKTGDGPQDELDRLLDSALAKYSTVEPRSGLEERVLANLQAERKKAPSRVWWHWGLSAVVAALVIAALSFSWRFETTKDPSVAGHPAVRDSSSRIPEREMARHDVNTETPRRFKHSHRKTSHPPAVPIPAARPRLDQFPSPQPLSEQELALAKYASTFPEEAALIATAQEEFEKETRRRAQQWRPEVDLHGVDQER
jgi:hypothetical protein